MKWASAVSQKPSLNDALDEAARDLRGHLGAAHLDFLAAFVSNAFIDSYEEASARLLDLLPAKVFTGCGAGGVIGAGREVEDSPAVSLVGASLPGARIKTFAVQDEDLPDLDDSPRAWEAMTGVKADEDPHFLIFSDPFSLRTDVLLAGLDYAFPKAAKIGGLASAGREPHQNVIFLDNVCLRSGAVGLAFTGNVQVETLVAQGCRPVGPRLRVTEARQNVVISLDGRPPMEVIQEAARKASPEDRALMQNALFLGLAMTPTKEEPAMGDFLVRNIVGLDREHGYLAVGALPRPGQMVQFHVRDARTSAEDLRQLLARAAHNREKPRGAMLFACQGRGRDLYGEPDVDSRLFLQRFSPVPLGGFFCSGEIGPVNGATYLHGFTSCFGLFSPRNP